MRAASQLSGRAPLVWMLPLYLHVYQKSDYDDDILGTFHQFLTQISPHDTKMEGIIVSRFYYGNCLPDRPNFVRFYFTIL